MEASRYIGEILVRHGAVTPEAMERALASSEEKGLGLVDVLLATTTLEQEALLRALATEASMPVLSTIKVEDIPEGLVAQVPITFARTHLILPIAERNNVVVVAVANPLDPTPLDDLRVRRGHGVPNDRHGKPRSDHHERHLP